jgi:hypothetical protein
MKSRTRQWGLIALFLILVPLLLLWQLPSAWLLDRVLPENSPFRVQNAGGSVWNGHINRLVWRGIDLGRVNWHFDGLETWSPPRSRWVFKGQNHNYHLDGRVSVSDGSAPALSSVSGVLPAVWVDLSQSLPFVFLDGDFEVDFERLDVRDGLPVHADGAVLWTAAGLKGVINENLGDIAMNVETRDQVMHVTIQSLDQVDVRIEGSGQLSGNEYTLDVVVGVAPHRQDVMAILSTMGTLQPDGSILLRLTGQFLAEGT